MIQNVGNNNTDCKSQINLINTFRKLWEQHIMWTRSFIISTAADLGDLQYVTNRLLRNPVDFSNVLGQYYGAEKAKKFSDLFTEHIAIAGRLVNAAKSGNNEVVNEQQKLWYSNADEIANYLASINPYWSKNEWQQMMYDHLKITEAEAVYRLTGQYEKDVSLYDAIEDQALMMADYMAKGIINQFHI